MYCIPTSLQNWDVNYVGFRIRVVSKYWDLQFIFKIWYAKYCIRSRELRFESDDSDLDSDCAESDPDLWRGQRKKSVRYSDAKSNLVHITNMHTVSFILYF